jgi:hypothetical protein
MEVRGGGNINSFIHPTNQTLITHGQPTLRNDHAFPS